MTLACRVALLCAAALVAAAAPAEAKVPKAPGGLGLYKPPKSLKRYEHGDLIWARRAESPLPEASRTWKLLYRSTSVKGRPVGVSGFVVLPKGRPPKGGWPVVSWAHGTTGIADVCAPSRDPGGPTTSYAAAQFDAWLRAGYAIANTDYEGLGTPGVHPYLVGRSEGRSVVDIVRAARQLDRRVGRRYVTAGHSQGGHAALFAAAVGPRWAPELKLRGVASFAPASHLGLLARIMTGLTTPNRLSGLSALMLRGMATAYPKVDLDKLLSDRARALFPQVDRKCTRELYAPALFGGLPPAEIVRPGADLTAFGKALDAQNPDLEIAAPVLLLQGLTDPLTQPFMSNQLAAELKKRGNRVTYVTYPGVEHIGIVGAADARTRRFLAARLG